MTSGTTERCPLSGISRPAPYGVAVKYPDHVISLYASLIDSEERSASPNTDAIAFWARTRKRLGTLCRALDRGDREKIEQGVQRIQREFVDLINGLWTSPNVGAIDDSHDHDD